MHGQEEGLANRAMKRIALIAYRCCSLPNHRPPPATTNQVDLAALQLTTGPPRMDHVCFIGTSEAVPCSPPALLQFTSGLTGEPKGVTISHSKLSHNVTLLGAHQRGNGCIVSWLPRLHDLGLIVSLLALQQQQRLVLLSPLQFAKSPLDWLQVLDHVSATGTAAPLFALVLVTNRYSESASGFQARLQGKAPSGRTYLRTGYLGFLDGHQLVVCGRLKEIIVIWGRNIFPADVESYIGKLDALKAVVCPGRAVAFRLSPGGSAEEKLVVLMEVCACLLSPIVASTESPLFLRWTADGRRRSCMHALNVISCESDQFMHV